MPSNFATLLLILVAPSVSATNSCDVKRTYELAASASYQRDQGLTQEQLRSPLLPRELAAKDPSNLKSAELLLMHQIVDELYLAPEVDAQTYATYKAEQCYRQSAGLPTPINYSEIVPRLIECGKLDKKSKIVCAMEAAGSSPQDGT